MKTYFTAILMALTLTFATNPGPASAQHVAGGIIAEYKDLDVAVIANGWSAMQLMRGNVYNDLGDFVGYVHDAIVLPGGNTTFVIVNVAGFLNIGHKLVAVPALAFGVKDNGDLVLPSATKDALTELPAFRYARP